MPRADITPDDVKATAEAKVEDLKESAQEAVEDVKGRLSNLTVNQKLVLTAVAAVAASLLIQKFSKRLRPVRISAEQLVLLDPPSSKS